MGVPYVPVYGLIGSDILRNRPDMKVVEDPFAPGRKLLVVKALRPQAALLHGLRADRAGNVDIGQANDDVLLAEASERVIVTVEEIVDELPPATTKSTRIPGILVDTVVEAPHGAHPGACADRYGVDVAHMVRYAASAGNDLDYAEYLRETVFNLPDHQAYLRNFVTGTPQAASRRVANG